MKRLLYLSTILAISAVLFGGTKTKAVYHGDRLLYIYIGSDQGVEKGMSGKVIGVVWDTVSKKDVSFTLGDFIVRDVETNSSELSVKLRPNADPNWISSVEFDDGFIFDESQIAGLQENIDKIKRHINNKDYAEAGALIEQTEKQYPGNNDLVLLKAGLNLLLADKITVKDYIAYKSRKPPDFLLTDVKEKLCFGNKEPNLPPENYLDKNLPITKNEKGYYEITFTNKNNHIMIYIPGKKLFVDKYEVSIIQAKKGGINVSSYEGSDKELKNYSSDCPGYPVMVSYEEAEKYCSKYGMKLPTEAEWEFIAGKDTGLKYSWGNDEVDENGIYRANYESMDDGYIDLSPVNSFNAFSSPYGAVNMIGNVSEWVIGKHGKGGSFVTEKDQLGIKGYSNAPLYVGFRCVMECNDVTQ